MRLKKLFTAVLVLTLSSQASAAESPPQPIAFERQAIEFSPTRPDLTVGIVWFTVLTPDKDWTVNVKNLDREDFDDRGDQKYLELKQVGKNRFELPALTIEPASEKSGAVCMSVKIWFNEIPNERLFFFVKLEDRYAQLSYCTRDVPPFQPKSCGHARGIPRAAEEAHRLEFDKRSRCLAAWNHCR